MAGASRRGLARSSERKGAVILEFAIVLPVLLMMILGSIEFGRAMMVANLLTSAARDGVRHGTLAIATNSDITGAVEQHLGAMAVSTDHVMIEITVNGVAGDVSEAETGDAIGVQVTVSYNHVSWLPTPDFLDGTQLQGVAVMRRE
jgi:Flp pilus assembly protein TadG